MILSEQPTEELERWLAQLEPMVGSENTKAQRQLGIKVRAIKWVLKQRKEGSHAQ